MTYKTNKPYKTDKTDKSNKYVNSDKTDRSGKKKQDRLD